MLASMSLFTIIAEYRGGTYVAQYRAVAPKQALRRWALRFPSIRGSFIGPKSRAKLCSEVCHSDNEPVPITGTDNVWFWSPIELPCFAVHVIRTERVRRMVAKRSFR